MKILHIIPGFGALLRSYYFRKDPELITDFLGMRFRNPVGLAAGFDKNATLYRTFAAFGFSHVEVGTVTPKPQPGNKRPRSFRLPEDRALINRMGFNNRGVDAMALKLNGKRPSRMLLGGNIGKNTLTPNEEAVGDYESCFRALYGLVDYFVVNVSCPNISDMHELQDQNGLERILGRLSGIRKEMEVYTPILLKISPDLNEKQIDTSIEIIEKYGIDGIVATNTTITREGLFTSQARISSIGNGGLSGAPLTRRSIEVVRYISGKTGGRLPIIGVGGIMSPREALDMLDAGATLIQVYTGFIYKGPGFVRKINRAILARKRSGIQA